MRTRYDLRATLDAIEFRLAKPRDIDGIVELYRAFYWDSPIPALGLEFDPERMRRWTSNAICGGHIPHIIATEGGVVGSINYSLDHSSTTKPFACLDKFYVLPEWRASGVGRTLLTLAMEAARGDGAVAFRAGISSGTGAAKNLFKRLGFTETEGSVLLARRL